MTQVHDIRKEYFEKGKSISQIARELGYDRKTIRAYIQKDDWNREIPNPKKVSIPAPSGQPSRRIRALIL